MKLKKQYAGQYEGETIVNGFNVKLQVSDLEGRGFTFNYFVNDYLVSSDGWYGLRLKDIKASMSSDIEYAINEYKKTK